MAYSSVIWKVLMLVVALAAYLVGLQRFYYDEKIMV